MSGSAPTRHALPALAVVGLGASIVPLDFAVNVAFPAITEAFGIATHSVRWVAICSVLTYGSLLLGFGALGDRIGHLQVFRAGLLTGAVAFVACALAPDFGWLLAARVLQGISVALTLSCAPALATLLVDEGRRTWALSAFAGTQALAGVAAPLVGGAAIALLGWPGVYWFRVPLVLLAFAFTPLLAGAVRPPPRVADGFDATGSAWLAAAVALLLLGPSLLGPGKSFVPGLAVSAAGVLTMAAFLRRQRAADRPFLPRAASADRGFRLVNLAACVVQFASFAVPLTVPYYLLRGGGWAPIESGAMLSVWALGTFAGSLAAPRAVHAIGARRAAFAGAVLAAVGLAGIASWPDVPHAGAMTAWLLLQGTALGLFQVAYQDDVVGALPASSRGVAGSLTMVTRTVGIVLGATVWMGILQAGESAALAAGTAPRAALVEAFGTVMRAAAIAIGAYLCATAPWRGAWFARPRAG